ncbi:hypothetical protein HDE_04574 [Halotydeus destructor]|nr:hypothetical protein HDE_04574 [Halotydeus destructor]
MVVSILLFAIGLICIPTFASKPSYLLSQTAIGLAGAGLNNAPNALLTEIWQEKCNPYIQTLHFSYAIGSVIGPLISGPFLAARTNGTNSSPDSSKSLVYIPCAISSVMCLCAALSLMILFAIRPYHNADRKIEAKTVNNNDNEETNCPKQPLIRKKKSKGYVIWIIVLCGLLFNFENGLEQNFFTYMQVYSVEGPLKISSSTGAYMVSTASAAFATGRLVGIGLATRISSRAMLYLDGVVMVTGSFIILLSTTEFGLWVGYVVVGFGCASVYPTIMAFAEQRINVTTYVAGMFVFIGSVSPLLAPFIEGKYVETYPAIFSYLNLACTVPSLLICSILHLIDLTRSRASIGMIAVT